MERFINNDWTKYNQEHGGGGASTPVPGSLATTVGKKRGLISRAAHGVARGVGHVVGAPLGAAGGALGAVVGGIGGTPYHTVTDAYHGYKADKVNLGGKIGHAVGGGGEGAALGAIAGHVTGGARGFYKGAIAGAKTGWKARHLGLNQFDERFIN